MVSKQFPYGLPLQDRLVLFGYGLFGNDPGRGIWPDMPAAPLPTHAAGCCAPWLRDSCVLRLDRVD